MNVDFAKFLALTVVMAAPLVSGCDLSNSNDDTGTSGAGTDNSASATTGGAEDPTATASATETGSASADDTVGSTAADSESGAVDSTGGSDVGTCCTIADTPGCSNPTIEACVCKADDFCCADDGIWDEVCISLAATECGADCEIPETTGATTGAAADCCLPAETAGCIDPKLETCVCDMDPFCCDDAKGAWDKTCVALAVDACFAEC